MPEQIEDDYDFSEYPWSKLLNGKTYRLRRGVDFKVKAATMAAYARAEGRERGTHVDTKVENDDHVVIKARGKQAVKVV